MRFEVAHTLAEKRWLSIYWHIAFGEFQSSSLCTPLLLGSELSPFLMDTSCSRMHKRKGLYLILIVLKRERSARIVRRLSESMSKAALIKSEPEQVVN